MEHNSGDYLHTLIEALKISFADTLWFTTDFDKLPVSLDKALSEEYAQERRKLINLNR